MKMMYRQIWIDKRDLDWQRVVWSPSSSDPIQHFRLLTVTYGTSCAPYLALRTIEQLCTDEGAQFPAATVAILRDRYVDDVLSGAPDLEAARDLRDQLIQLTNKGGFPLRKWVANDPRLLEGLNAADCLRPTWISFFRRGPGTRARDRLEPSRRFAGCRGARCLETPTQQAGGALSYHDGSHHTPQRRTSGFTRSPTPAGLAMAAVTYSRCEDDETGQVRLRILVAKKSSLPSAASWWIQRERRDQPSQGWSYGLRSSPPGSCVRPATSWPLTSTRAWPGRTQGSSSTGLIQPRRSAILWSTDTSIKSKN
ncbi:unnamed protein product [Trichogramma brassicae]|uniref:Reverse transcriptase domain-containing protein n=1 Tax=Trichogramma brassicae TaxID=86971 RepID=A0A6H5I0A3_9HYME|nr:unnamed protein product [Trichogramma brassicae]